MIQGFHPLTEEYLKKTDLNRRKMLGQYFTPETLRMTLLSKIPKIKSPVILDPACGTGEFLLTAKQIFKSPVQHGWEIDGTLADISKKTVPDAIITNADALKKSYSGKFDFVIGNPPYFEFKPDTAVRKKFADVICGRANIFSMFIKLGIRMLKKGGYLAYVVPPSMNNGIYFSKLRKFIVENSDIEHLEILNSSGIFHKAQQTVMLIVLKKGGNSGNFIFKKNNILIFSPGVRLLNEKFKNSTSLKKLGFTVRTGRIVWNQNKKNLTNNPADAVPLIWSHNITGKGLSLAAKKSKPQYVKTKNYNTGPAIVVNRITGAAGKANLKAAIIPKKMKFIAENHVNVIFPPKKSIISMKKLLKQIKSADVLEVCQNITGNTQISKTELENLFPIKTR